MSAASLIIMKKTKTKHSPILFHIYNIYTFNYVNITQVHHIVFCCKRNTTLHNYCKCDHLITDTEAWSVNTLPPNCFPLFSFSDKPLGQVSTSRPSHWTWLRFAHASSTLLNQWKYGNFHVLTVKSLPLSSLHLTLPCDVSLTSSSQIQTGSTTTSRKKTPNETIKILHESQAMQQIQKKKEETASSRSPKIAPVDFPSAYTAI